MMESHKIPKHHKVKLSGSVQKQHEVKDKTEANAHVTCATTRPPCLPDTPANVTFRKHEDLLRERVAKHYPGWGGTIRGSEGTGSGT